MKIIKGLIYTDKQYIEMLEKKIKELEEKNKTFEDYNKELNNQLDKLEERIDKAIEYIVTNREPVDERDGKVLFWLSDEFDEEDLLKILKGEENENN